MSLLIKNIKELINLIHSGDYTKILVIADDNTANLCVPYLSEALTIDQIIVFPSGEKNKNLVQCEYVWRQLTESKMDRHGLILNVGGGVVTDLGGFCAASYMRGVDFVQVPTSLLAMVDAAIGGKVGVNLKEVKNQIGLFCQPKAIFIVPKFLDTLPHEEWISGYAELYKHALIADFDFWQQLNHNTKIDKHEDWSGMIDQAIQIKVDIVSRDPLEKNDRKALNFGHTFGHAIESLQLSFDQPISHGLAVAMGMICESYLSYKRGYLTLENLTQITKHLKELFNLFSISSEQYRQLHNYALGDKKNKSGKIMCTLIGPIGHFHINQEISQMDIFDAMNYLNGQM